MLKIHRNCIYVIWVLIIISLLISAIFNYLYSKGYNGSVWYSYGTSLFIGIISSSILSIILEHINYFKSRRQTIEDYYYQIEKMMKKLCQFEQCEITDENKLNKNINLLKTVVNEDFTKLGKIYCEFAFLKNNKNKRNYLFSLYQYFYDIKRLISTNVEALDRGCIHQNVLDFINNTLLDIRKSKQEGISFTSIENKVYADIIDELYILVDMVNGKFKNQYSFNKTVLSDKVFKLETPEIENILKLLNDSVNKTNNYTVEIPFLSEKEIETLFEKHYINEIVKDKKGGIISVKVLPKAHYYFEFKDRYLKKYGTK